MEERENEVETFILSAEGEKAGVLFLTAFWRRKSKIIVMSRNRSVSDDNRLWQTCIVSALYEKGVSLRTCQSILTNAGRRWGLF